MSRRELIRRLIGGEAVERCGFWLGNPHADTWPILHRHFGTSSEEQLRQMLGDDVRWVCPQFYQRAYQDPSGRELFDAGLDRVKHKTAPLAHCETVAEVERFPWPKPAYLDFDACLADLRLSGRRVPAERLLDVLLPQPGRSLRHGRVPDQDAHASAGRAGRDGSRVRVLLRGERTILRGRRRPDGRVLFRKRFWHAAKPDLRAEAIRTVHHALVPQVHRAGDIATVIRSYCTRADRSTR